MKRKCEKHGDYEATTLGSVGGKDRYSTCPKCYEEMENKLVAISKEQERGKYLHTLNSAGIPLRYHGSSLDGFKADGDENKQKALQACKLFTGKMEEFLSKGVSIILCGKPGTGKTHLGCAMLLEAMKMGYKGAYVGIFDLFDHYKSTFSSNAEETGRDVVDRYRRPDLLVIDEVGVQYGSEAEAVIIFRILNERYNNLRSTIIISNFLAQDLSKYLGSSVVDRLMDNNGAIVPFNWASYRRG